MYSIVDFKHNDYSINFSRQYVVVVFFFCIFSHFYVGSMCLVKRLHLGRSCAYSLDNSLSHKSSLMLYNHSHYCVHLLLFPGTSIPITPLPTHSSSLLNTCPYHFNLLYWVFFAMFCQCSVTVTMFRNNVYVICYMLVTGYVLLGLWRNSM